MLTLPDLDFLTSAAGIALLARLVAEDLSDANTLPLLSRLRKDYTAQQAAAALETARLRLKAVEKFGDAAAQMLFTKEALEQASDPLVRQYRVQQLHGVQQMVDACCGIGSDALAFATGNIDVLGIDLDLVRVTIAQHNANVLGLRNAHFEVGDVTSDVPRHSGDFIFFDPARRDSQGNRIYDVQRYLPPLSVVKQWQAPRIWVKLSPGVDLIQLTEYGSLVEFISVNGDLKEALLRIGDLPMSHPYQATLLTEAGIFAWTHAESLDARPLSEPRGWLIEPDPALIRAKLVQSIAAELDGWLLDETIAYFTTEAHPISPWVRGWRILDWMPFNLKRLKAYLRERNVGTVTVKKRGSPLTPEALISQLKLKGTESRTLVLTRYAGQPIVMICEDYQPGS